MLYIYIYIYIWEQTAIISLYNIIWLVFITEMESVFCAVRSGYLNIIRVMCFIYIWEQTAIIFLCIVKWPVFITETESVYCAVRTGYLNIILVICFIRIWEQTAIISLYSINWLIFITETESVYCAVRTGYLLKVIQVLVFKGFSSRYTIMDLWSKPAGLESQSHPPTTFIDTCVILFRLSQHSASKYITSASFYLVANAKRFFISLFSPQPSQ